MTILTTFYAVVSLVCAFLILAHCLQVINAMGGQTDHVVRVAFILLCFAEFALLAGWIFGAPTARHFEVAALNFAVTVFAMFDRRRHAIPAGAPS